MKGGEMPEYNNRPFYKVAYNDWLHLLQPCEIDESELDEVITYLQKIDATGWTTQIDITDIIADYGCNHDGVWRERLKFKQPTEKQVESKCEAVELNIKLTEYCHKCSDGCCTNYGTITEINGEELPCHNQDAETILKQVLEHLGYKVNIETLTDYD